MTHGMQAEEIIERLALVQHPEGGWYRETFRDRPADGSRGSATAIFYLLRAGERSHWHRIDAIEIWHLYAGDALELQIAAVGPRTSLPASSIADRRSAAGRDGRGPGPSVQRIVLGNNLAAGELPQAVVPAMAWQSARPLGAWSLLGCTVSPAFEFAGFELAPADFAPT